MKTEAEKGNGEDRDRKRVIQRNNNTKRKYLKKQAER